MKVAPPGFKRDHVMVGQGLRRSEGPGRIGAPIVHARSGLPGVGGAVGVLDE